MKIKITKVKKNLISISNKRLFIKDWIFTLEISTFICNKQTTNFFSHPPGNSTFINWAINSQTHTSLNVVVYLFSPISLNTCRSAFAIESLVTFCKFFGICVSFGPSQWHSDSVCGRRLKKERINHGVKRSFFFGRRGMSTKRNFILGFFKNLLDFLNLFLLDFIFFKK